MTPSTLFCPLCGLVMQRKSDSWHCVAGDLTLPKYAVDEISAALDKSEVKQLEDCDGLELGMAGYCVRCGSEFLIRKPALRVCPQCSLSLHHGVFYTLQKYNDHKLTDEHYVVKWQKLKANKK
ncbi:MAG: hypothetical protein M9920_11575 [Verrucomicrobiae bacterium]|nr:hypothetical protein [Verrucomicrobiae bacterium]